MGTLPVFDTLQRDLRYGLRGLRNAPVFTATALFTIAIGIGANTAVFSVVDAVLLKPLSYPKPEQLVSIWQSAPGASGLGSVSGDLRLSASMYFTYAEQNRTFQSLGVWAPAPATVTGMTVPEEVQKVYVSQGVLESFQVPPAAGRWLGEPDQNPGGAETVMLGYGYWQRRFGASRSAIGKRIVVDGRPREIVGVMPKGFRILEVSPELIVPARFERSKVILPGFGYQAVGRLKPGVTLAQANADIDRMVPIWMNSWPAFAGGNPRVYEGWRIRGALRPVKNDVVGNVGNVLWIVMGTVGLVMLSVCANVGNLLLIRAEGRRQALAVRTALGASRGRIVRELLVESLLLSLIGGTLGAGLAWVALKVLMAIGPATLPRLYDVSLDLRALVFTFAASIACGALFGLAPAHRGVSGLNAAGRTSSATRERRRAQNLLVVCQVAMATVLLIASGLMIRTFDALRTVKPGFAHKEPMQLFRTAFSESVLPEDRQVASMQDEIAARIAALPGVTSVAFASALPLDGAPSDWDAIQQEGKTYEGIPPLRLFKSVSPGLFRTMGTRLLSGRDYSAADLEQRRRVVIVSENLARELWATPEAALGKRIQTLPTAPWRAVIGVVEDVRDKGLQEPAPATVYWPSRGESWYQAGRSTTERLITFVIRTRLAGTEGLTEQLRQAVWSVNPNLPMSGIQTMSEMYDRSLARTSFALVMIAITGSMALLLGIVGIYGVLSYAVTQRRREIGIRLALGAQQGALRSMFVRYGMMLAGIGFCPGVTASLGLTRLMSSLLFGIGFLDPITYAVALLILILSAGIASFVPASQASAVDPAGALKAE